MLKCKRRANTFDTNECLQRYFDKQYWETLVRSFEEEYELSVSVFLCTCHGVFKKGRIN